MNPAIVLCRQCQEPVEQDRRSYATPMCHRCLPPPAPLPIAQIRELAEERALRAKNNREHARQALEWSACRARMAAGLQAEREQNKRLRDALILACSRDMMLERDVPEVRRVLLEVNASRAAQGVSSARKEGT